jgi:hypothetical protein
MKELRISISRIIDIPSERVNSLIIQSLISEGFNMVEPIVQFEDYEAYEIVFRQK